MVVAGTDFLVQDACTILNLVGLFSALAFFLAVHLCRFSGNTDSVRERSK